MKQKDKWIARIPALLALLLALVALTSTFLSAAYLRYSNKVTNTMKPAESINPGVDESFNNTVKENVSFTVENEETEDRTEYPVYVRVAIVITWQQKDGTVYYKAPQAADYSMDLNMNGWEKKADGFYYFQTPVKSGEATGVLVNRCQQLQPAPEAGYTLNVEFIVQTVQAIGMTDDDKQTAMENAWSQQTTPAP